MPAINKLDFKIPAQLTKTLTAGRHILSDRGMGISKTVIEIEVKASQQDTAEAAENRARRFMAAGKVDVLV